MSILKHLPETVNIPTERIFQMVWNAGYQAGWDVTAEGYNAEHGLRNVIDWNAKRDDDFKQFLLNEGIIP